MSKCGLFCKLEKEWVVCEFISKKFEVLFVKQPKKDHELILEKSEGGFANNTERGLTAC